MKFTALLSAALLAQGSLAHPGQSAAEHAQEVAERRAYLTNNKRSLAHCADTLKARGNGIAMHARRSAMVEKLRAKRAIAQGEVYLRARCRLGADISSRETIPPSSRPRYCARHRPQVEHDWHHHRYRSRYPLRRK
jgi:hypothetical protein